MAAKVNTWVALLRGINVGGKNPVPMKALKALLEDLGHTAVATYIQSGNVVFRAPGKEAALTAGLREAVARTFKLDIPVVLRGAEELSMAVERLPFRGPQVDPAHVQVAFLADVPDPARVAKLDAARSPPDVFQVLGREIYMHCPHGFARTKLSIDYFERILGTGATARNWRTCTTLAEWAQAASVVTSR